MHEIEVGSSMPDLQQKHDSLRYSVIYNRYLFLHLNNNGTKLITVQSQKSFTKKLLCVHEKSIEILVYSLHTDINFALSEYIIKYEPLCCSL